MRKTANGTGRHIRLLIRKVLDLFFRSIGQIAGYYFHVVVLWVKLQATVLGVCWAIFLSL